MLSLGLLLVSCSFFNRIVFLPSPSPDTSTEPAASADSTSAAREDRSIFEAGLVPSAQSVLNGLDGATVYNIELRIADDLLHVAGSEEVRYTNTEDVGLNEVQFRLFPNLLGGEMTVSHLRADGSPVAPEFELEGSLMRVPLSRLLEPGQSVILQMDFAVTVPQSVELSYGVLAYYDNVLTLAHAYPMIAVYDDEGWNAEIPPQEGDLTFAGASFFVVKITAPIDLTLVTSGQRVSRDEGNQFQRLTVASGPARDFYLAASPDYEEVSQTFGEVTIRSYAPSELRAGSQKALDAASRALTVFSARYAPYPYTELDIVSTPTLALGVEYPGMIAIASRIYSADTEGAGNSAKEVMEATVAHETGHQWFYNLVGNDQLDDPWLDESLTQFATLQYFADEYGSNGEAGFRASLEMRWAGMDHAKVPISLPVASYQGAEYSAIIYGRGPLFFVALREEMGIEAFDSFLKDYTQTLSWGIATAETMQSIAEKHCDCSLQQIFDEWVYP